MSKRTMVLGTICYFVILFHGAKAQEKAIMSCWQTYEGLPSKENAQKFYQCLPSTQQTNYSDYAVVTDEIIENSTLLEKKIYSGNIEAIKIAFRLYTIADCAHHEILDIVLGKLITINPKLFLEELRAERKYVSSVGHLVGNFGPEYVDKMDAHNRERNLRIAALQSVTEPALVSIRDECVAALRE